MRRSRVNWAGGLPLIAEVGPTEGMQAMTSLPESRYVSLIERIKAQHAWELQHGWKSEESTSLPLLRGSFFRGMARTVVR